MIKKIIWRILTAPSRFYYTTWFFILALFEKPVPPKLKDRVENELDEPVWGKAEPINR